MPKRGLACPFLTSAIHRPSVEPVQNRSPQPASVELARQVGPQSRYFFLVPAPPDRPQPRVLYGGFEHCLPDYQIARASFPHHCLEVVVGGHGAVEVDGQWHELRQGSVFLYRPGRPWRMRGNGRESMRKYFVVFATGNGWRPRFRRWRDEPVRFEPLWELLALLEALEREAGHPGPERSTICNSLLAAILAKLRAHQAHPAPLEPSSWRTYHGTIRYIEEHFRQLRGLSDLARALGLDAAYLCRLFRRHGDTSPHQYLTRLRMHYAMTLLTREGLTVTAVAEQLGFKNPFHFSRVFRKVHRLPPSAFFSGGSPVETGRGRTPSAPPATGATRRRR